MIPTWLTIELAFFPLAIAVAGAVIAGIILVIRLEGKVNKAQSDADRALAEIAEVRQHSADHHDRLYTKIDHLSNCLYLILGKMNLAPPADMK